MPGTKDAAKAAPADKRGEYREKGHPAVRPREAATLVIVRQDQQPRVLMGKRAASHQFMPNKFVFPGGRPACPSTHGAADPVAQ